MIKMPAIMLTLNNTYDQLLNDVAIKIAQEMGNRYTKIDLLLDMIELQTENIDKLRSSVLTKYGFNQTKEADKNEI
jgi:hypothetical protein